MKIDQRPKAQPTHVGQLLMLTGSVVGDGEYSALEELFAARGGTLTFGGTLTRVHDCGESALPITFTVSSDQVPAHPAVEQVRQELDWSAELVCCLATSISIVPLGRHELPSELARISTRSLSRAATSALANARASRSSQCWQPLMWTRKTLFAC